MHNDHKLVNLFGQFIGLMEPLDLDDFKFFVDLRDAILNSKTGWDISSPEADLYQIPTLRAIEVFTNFFLGKYQDEEFLKIKAEIEGMSSQCPKNLNAYGVLDFYDFVYYCLNKHKHYLVIVNNRVKDLFQAADLNGDGFLQLNELLFLARNLKRGLYDMTKI